MADMIDLIRFARRDPAILRNEEALRDFDLTSAELETLRKLDPETMRTFLDAVERQMRLREVASSQACTGGSNACASRPALESTQRQ